MAGGSQHRICPQGVLKAERFPLGATVAAQEIFFLARGRHKLLINPLAISLPQLLELTGFEVALEIIDQVVWWISHDDSICLNQASAWLHFLSNRHGLTQFPVRFSIKLISSDKHGTRFFRRLQEDQVGGDTLVLVYLDNVSHLDLGRGDLLEGAILSKFPIKSCEYG